MSRPVWIDGELCGKKCRQNFQNPDGVSVCAAFGFRIIDQSVQASEQGGAYLCATAGCRDVSGHSGVNLAVLALK